MYFQKFNGCIQQGINNVGRGTIHLLSVTISPLVGGGLPGYIGMKFPTQLYTVGDEKIGQDKDPYQPIRIQWNVISGF